MSSKPKPRRNMWCTRCHINGVGKKRAAYGHTVCQSCGQEQAEEERLSWCVVPMHKSNYMLITSKADLVGLNQKGGLVK